VDEIVTLSEEATSDLVVSLSASDIVTVISQVVILDGQTSASFDVVSGSQTGTAAINATASGITGDTAAVFVSWNVDIAACRARAHDAAQAARTYAKAANAVGRACKSPGTECDVALDRATAAREQLESSHSVMLGTCN
jgi:hypothetical protein